jgi:hypothetical protein
MPRKKSAAPKAQKPAARQGVWMPALSKHCLLKYALVFLKAVIAGIFVFGAITALIGYDHQPVEIHGSLSSGADATMSGNRVAIRNAPKITVKIIERGDWNTTVKVLDQVEGWARVRSEKPKFEGWVEQSYLKF